jgi:hypothetical protein
MQAKLDILKEVFEEWLQIQELDHDYWVYTSSEWEVKEGKDNILKGAELVFAFENDLVRIFHFDGNGEIEEELQDLAEGFGYYFEHGNVWNFGFYPLEDQQKLPPESTPYAEKLKDQRWQQKRQRIISRSEGKCENCGAKNVVLDVHHCYYRFGRHPWQYPDASLLALCKQCHKERAKAEVKWRVFQPQLSITELLELKRMLRDSLYWYDRSSFFEFLEKLGHYQVDAIPALREAQERMNHPHERNEKP